MMKYAYFFKNNNKATTIYKLFFTLIFLFLQGCGGCETAEELGTEERKVEINSSYPVDYIVGDHTSLWKSSDVFVNTGGLGGTDDITFSILHDDVNLCPDSKDIHIGTTEIAQYLDTEMNVKSGESVKISLIKKTIKIDCENSAPGIFITDKEKCLNGYYKKDGSNAFVPPAHGQTIELESYVAIPNSFEMPFAVTNDFNDFKDYFHNALVSQHMLLNGKNNPLFSKALLVPAEYESSTTIDGKTVYSYSEFPEIPGDDSNPMTDLGLLTQQMGSNPNAKKIEDEVNKYWCRSGIYNGKNQNPNINGTMLHKFCDKFYYFDKDKNQNNPKLDSETLMEYSAWEAAPLNAKNSGNLNKMSQIISIMENKSYRKVNVGTIDVSGMELPDGVTQDQLQNAVGGDQYISLVHSKSFLILDGAIENSMPTSGMNMGNFNTDFIDCSQTSYVARCAWGNPMIPLDQNIETKRDGRFYMRIGTSNLLILQDKYYGNADINISKHCKLRNLVAYVLPMDGTGNLNVLPMANSSNFIKIPILDSQGERLSEFTIKGSDIKNDGFIYFAVEDNGDGYTNNTGSIKIKTRVPKNFKDNALKFFSNLSGKIMDIIFGKKNPVTALRSGGVANLLFNNMINSQRFQSIIRIAAALSVIIYGICIVTGMVQSSASELTKKVFKFGTVFVLLQPYAWEFFNKYLFSAMIDGARDLAAFTTVPPPATPGAERPQDIIGGNEKYIFGPLADMVERLLDFSIWKQILALIFAGPFGTIFFVFLQMTLFSLLEGTFMVFLTYVSSMLIMGILISIAPLFIITLLFQSTSHIFKEWIKILISNMITIVLVFAGINMISGIISMLVNQVFGFGVCTSCVLTYDLTDNFPICLFHAALPDGYDATADISDLDGNRFMEKATNTGRFFNIPIPFGSLLALCIMCPLVKTFHEFCTNMASELTGVDFGSPVSSKNVASSVGDSMKWWVGKDEQGKRQSQQAAAKQRSDVSGVKVRDE